MRGKVQKSYIGLGEGLEDNIEDIYFSLDKFNPFISPVKIGLYSQIPLVSFCSFISLIFKITFGGSYWGDFLCFLTELSNTFDVVFFNERM